MKVLVADVPWVDQLRPLPEGAELVHEPGPGIEFVVVGPEMARTAGDVLAALPDLRVVQSTQAGVDWLDPLVPPGVELCGASGAHDIAVAEWIVATLLAVQRRLPEFLDLQRRGEWDSGVGLWGEEQDSPIGPIEDLHGATVVVLGHGSIGRALAERLTPFGVTTVGIARRARPDALTPDALPEVLPTAAALVVLTPLTPETHHLVGADVLSRMRRGAVLVNAARGPVVDTGALVTALHAGQVRAALDVTDPEPLPPGHPLWSAPNVLITPHVAASTTRWLPRAYTLAGEQLRRYAAGEPLINRYRAP